MLILFRKTLYLILYGRAVAWTDPLDLSGIKRGAIQASPNNIVSAWIGIGDMTGDLRRPDFFSQKRKRSGLRITMLLLQLGIID